ncbi:MAG: SgcJ/EcaC family oxidoreductase [Gammaproteobacteria bacterium]|nr:SgcJ/EcaC family oxidoreductase [Gammaproteobacteria bacterium]
MNSQLMKMMAVALCVVGQISIVHAASSEQKNIHKVLKSYEQVLNASDVAGVAKLYTKDGVFMAQHKPSVVGISAIKAAYKSIFQVIDLNINFDIIEIEVIADDWAFARTNSAGTATVNATGDKIPEGNQELFLFKKNR